MALATNGNDTHCHKEEEEEEKEEMRSPGRVHPLANPMVPSSPHRSDGWGGP